MSRRGGQSRSKSRTKWPHIGPRSFIILNDGAGRRACLPDPRPPQPQPLADGHLGGGPSPPPGQEHGPRLAAGAGGGGGGGGGPPSLPAGADRRASGRGGRAASELAAGAG